MQENQNPLTGYFRKPEIYIKLPSQGRYYPPGSIDLPTNGELGVFPMTAKDELIMKTPDALLNGSGTVEVIRSCVPAIKDPWQLPSLDLDVILIGIRIATYGDEMELTSTCPECKEQQDLAIDLGGLMTESMKWQYNNELVVGDLTIMFKPLTYQEMTSESMRQFEQNKLMKIINDENLDDESRQQMFNESFIKLTAHTINLIRKTIKKVTTPQGETEDVKHIQEFIENADRKVFSAIQEHLDKQSVENGFAEFKIKCSNEKCVHEYTTPIVFDQTNFFV